jgi:hypothetical protein
MDRFATFLATMEMESSQSDSKAPMTLRRVLLALEMPLQRLQLVYRTLDETKSMLRVIPFMDHCTCQLIM